MKEIKFKKSSKIPANQGVSCFCSLCYLWLGFLLSLLIFTELDRKILVAAFILIVVLLVFFSKFFEWILNPVLVVNNDKLIYRYDSAVFNLGSTTSSFTIYTILRYKVYGNKVKIWGSISNKEPLVKSKSIQKCVISGLYDEIDRERVIEVIKNFQISH